MSLLLPNYARVDATVEDIVYACDSTAGDDANAGTLASPKKTIPAMMALFTRKMLRNKITAVIKGDHDAATIPDPVSYSHPIWLDGGSLLIKGEDALVTVADDAGSPWVADIHSVTGLGKGGVGWAVDQWKGWLVEVVDGLAAGETRTIHSNTATTLRPHKDWSIDPGHAQFRIVRPKTRLIGNGAWDALWLSITGPRSINTGNGCGIRVQNLFLDAVSDDWSNGMGLEIHGQAGWGVSIPFAVSGIVMEHAGASLGFECASLLQIDDLILADDQTTLSAPAIGCSEVPSAACGLNISSSRLLQIRGLVCNWVGWYYSNFYSTSNVAAISHGTRIPALYMQGSRNTLRADQIRTTVGYAPTVLGGDAAFGNAGIELHDGSAICVGAGVDISNSTTHGVIVDGQSAIKLDGVVTGTGNLGAGVYAHGDALVLIKHGATPTLTGAVGNLAVSNPAAQESTWAAIDGGTPVAIANEKTLAREE